MLTRTEGVLPQKKKPKKPETKHHNVLFYLLCGLWYLMKNLSVLSVEVKHRQGWWQCFYILRLEKQTLVSCKSNDGCHRLFLLLVLLSLAF